MLKQKLKDRFQDFLAVARHLVNGKADPHSGHLAGTNIPRQVSPCKPYCNAELYDSARNMPHGGISNG